MLVVRLDMSAAFDTVDYCGIAASKGNQMLELIRRTITNKLQCS